jgi:soluble lytic murein transglycosylase-like protein
MSLLTNLILAAALTTAVVKAPAPRLRLPITAAKYQATVVREAHAKGGLTAPVAMFAGQLTQESQFNPNAHSGVGAQGLAQFMPPTALWLTKVAPKDFPTANSLDPNWSIRALIFYDYWLEARTPMYTAEKQNRWAAALAGYNGGLGYVFKAAKIGNCQTWFGCAENVNVGRSTSNQLQNKQYPDRIIHIWEPLYVAADWK